jgi:uncharacterized protein YjiS (DUF1127 family)
MSTTRTYPATLTVPAATHGQAGHKPIRLRDVLAAAIEQVMVWHDRARQRRQLHSLSDHMLRDLGLGRADVAAETSKRFWQP